MRPPPWPLRALAHGALALVCALVLYPALWVVKLALAPGAAPAPALDPLPREIALDNLARLVGWGASGGAALFLRQAASSLAAAAMSTAIGLALATTAAYALSRFRFPGREAGLSALLVTQMFPGVIMVVPLYLLLDRLGLLDSIAGLSLVYATTALPFCVFMLKGYFDTLPRELEDAALIDGATRFGAFRRVALPLARPALAVTALFSFMTAWNEFILAATFLSDERAYTLPVVLQGLVGDYSADWGAFAAGAVLVSLPVVALFYALQRHLVGGLTAGGIKG